VLAGIRDDSVSRRRRKASSPGLPRDLGQTHPLRILLAEDNAVNQKVACSYLSRMGYRADLATTGREALEAALREAYDVILMDVQMPEMDGLEATQRIRALLPRDRGPWIVALTASAMTGDAERCTAAGMNDYLSKPVRIEDLAAALRRVPRRTPRAGPAGDLPVVVPGPLEALQGLETAGEPGFLDSLLAIFLRDTPARVAEMERSLAAGDAVSFRRAAHSLKSSAASLGGARVEAVAARMERLSTESGTLTEAALLLPSLRAECAALFEALGVEARKGSAPPSGEARASRQP
jgi:CheY-like chemotaxis protein